MQSLTITFTKTGQTTVQAWVDTSTADQRVGSGHSVESAIGDALRQPRLRFETGRDEVDAIIASEYNRALIVQVRPHHQMRCLGTR